MTDAANLSPGLSSEQSSLSRREQLLWLLADGQCHSGEDIATQLQVTRAAIWKGVESLRELNIDVLSTHQGYQLPHAVQMIDAARLATLLQTSNASLELQYLFSVDSTNRHVMAQTVLPGKPVLCIAELQTAGKGRRGRSWLAPFGAGISLSIGYCFDALPPGISALSLVMGVAIVRVLRRQGLQAAQLKWPNDVQCAGRKLAGVLIEMRGEPDGGAQLVIGIGMNVRLPEAARATLQAERPVCDLHEYLGEIALQRNLWAAQLAQECLSCLDVFAAQGFAPFHAEWQQYDALHQQPVRILNGQHQIDGVAAGVSEDGSLLLQTTQGVQRFVSGEVSLRPAQS